MGSVITAQAVGLRMPLPSRNRLHHHELSTWSTKDDQAHVGHLPTSSSWLDHAPLS